MVDEITNKVLLEHMQGMKYELQQQIKGVDKRVQGLEQKVGVLDQKVGVLDQKVGVLDQKVDRGFEEAREHRQALQEDLEATIVMQAKHQRKLEKISV